MAQKRNHKKICEECRQEYFGTILQKYCSVSCRLKHYRKNNKGKPKKQPIKQAKEEAPKIMLPLIVAAWAARKAGVTYGAFVQALTEEEKPRILEEYAAFLREKEKKV